MDSRDFDFEPDFDAALGMTFYSIPVDKMPEMVAEYISKMETERTNDWCKCEWLVHPDDEKLDIHNCRECGHPRLLHNEITGMEGCAKKTYVDESTEAHTQCDCGGWVDPPKRRMRRGETNLECPVHTKEGFLIGFFKWVFGEDDGPKR